MKQQKFALKTSSLQVMLIYLNEFVLHSFMINTFLFYQNYN